ncbi:MAG: glycosyltransferase [Trueperaceae bacterium]|nr:glycosyltransferase [Trueperaceae bacterium]
MTSRTILFDTIAAGGGHVATARAMRDAVERVSRGRVRGEVRDAMAALDLGAQDRRHKRTWSRLLRVPWLVRAGQRAMEMAPSLVHAAEARWLDELARRAAADLNARPVDLVVVNHGFLMVAYARARQRYGLRRTVVTFATEPFDANALWAEPDPDRVVAPSLAARTHLIRLGVPAERIDLMGYPVAGAILTPRPQEEARRRLGLTTGRWALLSLGGEGVADRPEAWIEALVAAGWQVMVVAGRNEALRERLSGHPGAGVSVSVHGFVDDMPLRLAAVDVVVGKAGPASALEAVAAGRPFVATSYAGLNERAVIAYLEASGTGRYLPHPDDLAAVLGASFTSGVPGSVRAAFQRMSERLGVHLTTLADGTAQAAPLGLDVDPWSPRTATPR